MKKLKATKEKSPQSAISKKSFAELEAEEKKKVHSKPYPIVAIGASAGGMEAIMQLLKNLKPDTGMAYVYIQHLDPEHKSMLSVILAKATSMPVVEAEEKMRIQPDHVFIIPPGKDMEIIDGVLTLNPRPLRPHLHLPVNRFFQSLAEKQKDGAIGIVLSGNASDGTVGLKAIKAAGGITIAQDDSAKFKSMPMSAVAEGVVDLVLHPVEIAKELERISRHTELLTPLPEKEKEEEEPPTDISDILELLRKSTGVDFNNYKKNTVQRRIERRMLLNKLKSQKEYYDYLRQHTDEIQLLYNDMLINVTSFFRDAEVSEYLQKTLLPQIIKSKSNNDPVRIWIPACSTGQEAYSTAMLVSEALGNKQGLPVQIFASDLSENAILKARVGLYSKSEVADVSPERLQRFFTKEDGHYRIIQSIRDKCVFAVHNIFKDPPFSRLDLVSCCNLLIYLDTALQRKALTTFHYALYPGGYLVLGKTETTSAYSPLFTTVEKSLKIFQNTKDQRARSTFDMKLGAEKNAGQHSYHTGENIVDDYEKAVDRLLLSRYVPASVVVNEEMEILQFRGSTGLFLEPSPGKASLNLIRMAREGLGFELRNAIHKATKTGKPERREGIEIKYKNQSYSVAIEAVPLKYNEGKTFLVIFEEEKLREVPVKTKTDNKRVQQLERELESSREDMGSIIEEREAMNEELQSANEEAVSSNEELQSINEELETSKEEIESSNEELQTINEELQMRNDQLSEAFTFSDAVFTTMREALLVLDEHLRVIRANYTFYKIFKTKEEETSNRLIYDLGNGQWDIPKLRELLNEIIPENHILNGFEVEHIFPGIGQKIMVLNARIMVQPISRQKMILLAIEDVTNHVLAQRILAEKEQIFRKMANDAPVMIWTSDEKGNRNFFNKTWLEFTGKPLEEEIGMGWLRDVNPVDREGFMKIYKDALENKSSYRAEYRLIRKDKTYRWMLSQAKATFDINNSFTGFIGTVTEIHDQRMINEELEERVKFRTNALEEAKLHLERTNEELKQFAYVASHDLQEPLRKISTFSDQLQIKFKKDLPEPAQDYLDRIKRSSLHMMKLISDLLDFSRANRHNGQYAETNLNGTVLRVLKDYELLISQKNAKINLGTLPEINAIPVQMVQLFSNLIGNALKFTNERPPEITIEARELTKEDINQFPVLNSGKEYSEITVKDNGIGFEPGASEMIFNIFQRLHSNQDYPGTGIGLALCRRIVENHGGLIFAEGNEDKGSAFHVLLPLN